MANDGIRSRNLFDPASPELYRLSRSKLELFLECPRCFYLDRRRGIGRPDGPAFSLNIAVDALLKREFDSYRAQKKPHPLMQRFGIDAVPFAHSELERWRDNRKGIEVSHATGFLVFGSIDDLWIDAKGELLVVDYKATSTEKPLTLDDPWKQGYKRQMEVYQWLLSSLGFAVSSTGYFLFCNALKDRPALNQKLEFSSTLLPHNGDTTWIDDALIEAHACLCDNRLPPGTTDCAWCAYRRGAVSLEC